jgi:hypothetical protein
MIDALRTAAAPALRVWIDANARDVLAAAAPSWMATLPAPTLAALERTRRGVGDPLSDKNAARLFAWIGVTATPGVVRVPLTSAREDVGVAHIVDTAELERLRVVTGLPVPILRPFDNGHGFVGHEIALAGLTVPVGVLHVSGPDIAPATVSEASLDGIGTYSLGRFPSADKPTPTPRGVALRVPGVRALLASALGARTPDEERAHKEREKARVKREEATARGYATCGVCFGTFALNAVAGTLVQHGYRMGGGKRGYLYKASGDCDGAGWRPWEKSPDATRSHAGRLRSRAEYTTEYADKWERGEIRTPFHFKVSPGRFASRQTRTRIGELTLIDAGELRAGYTRLVIEAGHAEYPALAAAHLAEQRAEAAALARSAVAYARAADEWPADPLRPGGALAAPERA